jgi:hypothetical protein
MQEGLWAPHLFIELAGVPTATYRILKRPRRPVIHQKRARHLLPPQELPIPNPPLLCASMHSPRAPFCTAFHPFCLNFEFFYSTVFAQSIFCYVGVHTGSCEFTGHKYPIRTRDLVIKYKTMDSLEAHMPLDVKEIGI